MWQAYSIYREHLDSKTIILGKVRAQAGLVSPDPIVRIPALRPIDLLLDKGIPDVERAVNLLAPLLALEPVPALEPVHVRRDADVLVEGEGFADGTPVPDLVGDAIASTTTTTSPLPTLPIRPHIRVGKKLLGPQPVDVKHTRHQRRLIHGIEAAARRFGQRHLRGADEQPAAEAVVGRQDAHPAEAEAALVVVVVFVGVGVVFVVGAGEAEDGVPGNAEDGLAGAAFAGVVDVGVEADADVAV